jgi:hypothetical protein
MAEKAKPRRPKIKPGLREERLVITGDPQQAIDALVAKRPKKRLTLRGLPFSQVVSAKSSDASNR